MSLQNGNELGTVEREENVQRAAPIFPLYSVILVAGLVVVSLVQFAVDGASSILLGGEKSVLLAGFLKPAFVQGEYWRILTGRSAARRFGASGV